MYRGLKGLDVMVWAALGGGFKTKQDRARYRRKAESRFVWGGEGASTKSGRKGLATTDSAVPNQRRRICERDGGEATAIRRDGGRRLTVILKGT